MHALGKSSIANLKREIVTARKRLLRGLFISMLALSALSVTSTFVSAAPFEDGRAAYDRGDYATALVLLRPLAEQANASLDKSSAFKAAGAQSYLGKMYEYGQGVAQDYKEAVHWYQLAAEGGYAPAGFNLGNMYDNGIGVPKSAEEAVKWYRRAAEQGYDPAQLYLGLSYAGGEGVEQNYTEAAKWFQKAAEQGNDEAQSNLGFLYSTGQGLPQDDEQAVQWYRRAAEQGFGIAQNNLAIKYEDGKGVKKDFVQAYKWFSLAASVTQGTEQELEIRNDAAKKRDLVASKMTSRQIAQAQKLVHEWKPTKSLSH